MKKLTLLLVTLVTLTVNAQNADAQREYEMKSNLDIMTSTTAVGFASTLFLLRDEKAIEVLGEDRLGKELLIVVGLTASVGATKDLLELVTGGKPYGSNILFGVTGGFVGFWTGQLVHLVHKKIIEKRTNKYKGRLL